MRLNNLTVDSNNGKTAVLFEVDGDFTSEQLFALLTGGSGQIIDKPVTVVPKKKRGRPRKDATATPAPQASAPAPQTAAPKRKYFRRAGAIEIPLSECLGHAFYQTKKGNSLVAIYKEGEKNGRKWVKLLWADADKQIAFHPQGGFFGNAEKMSGIERY